MNRQMRRAERSKKGDKFIQPTPAFNRGQILQNKTRMSKSIGYIKVTDKENT